MNKTSKARIDKAHPDLKRVMVEAVTTYHIPVEFSEVLRSKSRQAELVAAGASKTMNSRHLTGHACDCYFLVGGKPRWDWSLYYDFANHVKKIARKYRVLITWGGVWDRQLNFLDDDIEKEIRDYVTRARKRGIKKPLVDGPHFELSWAEYPST